MPLPKKKKAADHFALLLGDEHAPKKPGEKPGDSAYDDEPDEDEDDLGLGPDSGLGGMGPGDEGDDDMGGDDPSASIDPEQAHLAKKLGFTEPEQQKALIDLIQLVAQSGAADTGGDLGGMPPAPESSM